MQLNQIVEWRLEKRLYVFFLLNIKKKKIKRFSSCFISLWKMSSFSFPQDCGNVFTTLLRVGKINGYLCVNVNSFCQTTIFEGGN